MEEKVVANEFDVIVVGAGHNGLTAGCYLAKAGRRVAIVERGAKVGGMTTSGYMIPEAPNHLVTPCAVEVIFMRGTGIIEDLELGRHGFKTVDPDPSYVYLHPDGGSIALFRDPARTAEDISRFSRKDGQAYLKFMDVLNAMMDIGLPMMMTDPSRPAPRELMKTIRSLVRHRKLKDELTLMANGTSDQIACEWFEHPATIGFLTNIAAGAGPLDEDGNAAAYVLVGLLHRLGVGKPIGSLQSLSSALGGAFEGLGGTIRLNASVDEIIISDGRARGVRLADGSVMNADAVIATCDPRTAFKLTTPGGLDKRLMTRIEHAPSARGNIAPFLANVATSGPLMLKRHQDMRHDGLDLSKAVGLIGVPEHVRDSFACARRGDIPAHPAVSVSPLSNWDPSQAPAGQSIAYIYLPAIAVDPRGGWTPELKNKTMDIVMATISEYYDGFQHEIGRFVESPRDREQRVNVTNGCVTHIDFAASRTGSKRPGPGLGGHKPIAPGFFIGGAGIHPGGGVSGLPGRISAGRVDRWLRKSQQ